MRRGEDLVLMAGGRIEGRFAREAGTPVKTLIRIAGKSVLERTLDAFQGTGRFERVLIVGPPPVAAEPCARRADAVLPERETPFASLVSAFDWLRGGGEREEEPAARVIVAATDLPFPTPAAVERFLDGCPPDSDLCVPVVEREAFESCFPDTGRTFVPLRDGEWKVGSVVGLRSGFLQENRARLERIFAARKSPVALARVLGVPFLLRFVFRRLTVDQVERRGSEILAGKVSAVRNSPPELAFDLDHLRSYRSALSWARRTGAPLTRRRGPSAP